MKKLLIVVLLMFASTTWAGDFEDGVTAFKNKNYPVALAKFRLAGTKGDAFAQSLVGGMFDEGLGVAQDYVEAVRWYKLAAEQGDAGAQLNLGVMFNRGQGVAQDFTRAHMWYNLAAVSGDKGAVKNRDLIAAEMTPQQIAQAQKLARECTARNFQNCD